MEPIIDLLPDLGVREVWAVGLVVVLTALRPVGRTGWLAGGAIVAAGIATAAAAVDPTTAVWPRIAIAAWIVLAIVLAATALLPPLRWEPRTGPSAATAMLVGAAVIHAGQVWHAGGVTLGETAQRWASGNLSADSLDTTTGGPLAWVLAWPFGALPGAPPRAGAAVLGIVAAVVTIGGAERLGRRWGYVGTARCTAAAVAWAPPLLLAHDHAPAALAATAALVASWWSLVEVWGGRHRSGRLAFASGALLGLAVGVSIWPVIVGPLWLRRLSPRTAGWFTVGLGVSLVAAVLALVPTDIGLVDLWRATVAGPIADGLAPEFLAIGVVVASVATLAIGRPLTPTRLSAVTAAVVLTAVAWWPAAGGAVGPVAAAPFVLLAAVAPDRPEERWPPDRLTAVERQEVPA